MAARYQPLRGPRGPEDDAHDMNHDAGASPSPFSPTSTSRSSLPSPTHSHYLSLAEQTFTPLSMDGSDFFPSDAAEGDHDVDAECKDTAPTKITRPAATAKDAPDMTGVELHGRATASAEERPQQPQDPQPQQLEPESRSGPKVNCRAATETRSRRPTTSASASASTVLGPVTAVPPATVAPSPSGRGATVVNALVQSFEALQATRAGTSAGVGYDHVSTKNPKVDDLALTPALAHARARAHSQLARRHLDSGLVSPPSTLSPVPSRSPSPRRPAAAGHPSPAVPSGEYENTPIPPAPAALPTRTTTEPSDPAPSSQLLKPTAVADFAFSTPTTTQNTIVRPTPTSSPPRTPQPSLAPDAAHAPIVRTSSTASLALSHPAPDLNKRSRSGAFLGNVAALEASAERLSMTSSIEDAIRQEHNELKRSDSRRSSILRANSTRSTRSTRKASDSDAGSVFGGHLSVASRQNSIVGLNTAARSGGYSPGGFVMAQPPAIAGVASDRLRAGSKAGSMGAPPALSQLPDTTIPSPEIGEGGGEGFPFLARQGPGKSSTRSTASKLSLIQSAELETPTALTKEAFDQADRAGPGLDDADDDDTIRASAYQHIEAQFADDSVDYTDASQPMLAQGDRPESFPPQQYESGAYPSSQRPHGGDDQRPTTSGSEAAYDQAQGAFGDFDGVHCDPDMLGFGPPPEPAFAQPRPRHPDPPAPRPKSYFDPATGQQMMFYPAPVPAMLNLPPKLSKKPKAAAMNTRRSQMVVSAMPQESRASRVWLPNPVRGSMENHEPFMTDLTDLLGDNPRPAPPSHNNTLHMPGGNGAEFQPGPFGHGRQPSETSTIHPAASQPPPAEAAPIQPVQGRAIRRPQRLTDTADKRQTRATMLDGLPPQLRASAFFDLPSSTPHIELKDGSAQATLDSILDASAAAPVSAFTDHVFAGKLGAEVYGPEKKKKKRRTKKPAAEGQAGRDRDTVVMGNTNPDLLQPPPSPKKRSSHFSLLPGKRRTSEEAEAADGRSLVDGNEDRRRELAELGGTYSLSDREPVSPDEDELSSEDEEEDEEELYEGPPTTLLAELQLRKQQNKLRTRPAINAHPNGMHSTLLELDAVREIERKARHGRVNLAWENPDANPVHNQDLEDDDVPLGLLAVAKATGAKSSNIDISLVVSEMNRPLGLMERREMDDNEPLSRRRDRLQGRQTGLQPQTLDAFQHRVSQINLSPYGPGGGLRSQSRLGLGLPSPQQADFPSPAAAEDEEDDDDEGETLAQRKARLAAADPLPRARPVSGMFSAELLSQFGGDPDEEQAKDKGKDTPGPDSEAEETLGQRRRRLQAEREAQERGQGVPMAGGLGVVGYPDANRVSRRLSMADMLGAYPREGPMGPMDPRGADHLRREQELARAQGQRDLQMAALRAQMPQTLAAPSFGAPNGGFMNGRFNDGAGGVRGLGYGGDQVRMSGYAPGGLGGQYPNMNISPTVFYGGGGGGGGMANAGPGAMGPGPQQGGDMVERWRQGVMY